MDGPAHHPDHTGCDPHGERVHCDCASDAERTFRRADGQVPELVVGDGNWSSSTEATGTATTTPTGGTRP